MIIAVACGKFAEVADQLGLREQLRGLHQLLRLEVTCPRGLEWTGGQ